MIGYEVWLNGERLCLASVGESGVLSTVATWVRRTEPDGTMATEHELSVGGLATTPDDGSEHLDWAIRPLAVGDELRIKIMDILEADPPRNRRQVNREADRAAERQYYEHLKTKYETQT
jgi:hypothetical protein